VLEIIICCLIFAYGCDSDKGEHAGIGYLPSISQVVSYNYNDTENPVSASVFNVGDSMSFTIDASDDDLNMKILWITIYDEADDETPYMGPLEISLPDQAASDVIYYYPFTIVLDDPSGQYTIDFQIEDERGNLTDIYTVNYTITD